jgi:ketosteroid isomerase-like protein
MKTNVYSLAALLCLTLPTVAQPAAVPSARREIQAAYNSIDAALARKDIDTALDYDADDCQFYDRKGRQVDTGGRQELEDLMEKVDTVRETTKILSITGTSTEATVVVKTHTVAGASNRINGRAAKGVFDEVARDYWIKTDAGWRRKRSRVLQSKGTLHKNF